MPNPTTPQPVQEPAGAVEAIKRLRQSLETWTGCEGAVCNREDVAVVLDALASLQPVTQAKSEAVVPEYWQWRRKGTPWSLDKTFNSEPAVTTDDSEKRALYTHPAASMEVQGLTSEEVDALDLPREPDHDEKMAFVRALTRALAAKNGWRPPGEVRLTPQPNPQRRRAADAPSVDDHHDIWSRARS